MARKAHIIKDKEVQRDIQINKKINTALYNFGKYTVSSKVLQPLLLLVLQLQSDSKLNIAPYFCKYFNDLIHFSTYGSMFF